MTDFLSGAAFRSRLSGWFPVLSDLLGRSHPERGAVTLTRNRVYILPTRQGMVFSLLLFAILLGSINYNLGLGYLLTFFLGALAMVAILHTYRNLAGIRVYPGPAVSPFAGQPARFPICFEQTNNLHRYHVGIKAKDIEEVYTDIGTDGSVCVTLAIPTEQRGRVHPGRLTLFTRFPLGLFHAWAYVEPDVTCIVYPKPAAVSLKLQHDLEGQGEGSRKQAGQENFSGLRGYQASDSPRHVAWKAFAREQGMLTKQFEDIKGKDIWLDWDDLSGMGTEERLSQLCRWVLDAASEQWVYGLRLPDKDMPPSRGKAHRQRCLETLALYGMGSAS